MGLEDVAIASTPLSSSYVINGLRDVNLCSTPIVNK